MGRGEPPARLPELHSHHFPDKGIAWRSRSSSQGAGRGPAQRPRPQHMGCRMAAYLHQGWLLSLLPAVLLSLRSPPAAPEPVTSQDAALLAGVPEDILCFSRSFEDLTCFWDEEEEEEAVSRMCHFYYWYSRDAPTACAVSTLRRGAGGTRHVCVFPSQDVRLFTQLHLCVLDAITNQTKYWRELSVDAVGESLPLGNTPVTPGQSPDLGPLSCLLQGLAAPCTPGTDAVLRDRQVPRSRTRECPDGGCCRRANAPACSPQVSSPPQQTSRPAGLGLQGSSACHGSHHLPTTRTSSSTRCSAALPAPQRCPAAPCWTPVGSTLGTLPASQPSAPTHPWLGQPQPPWERGRYIEGPGMGRGIWGLQLLPSLAPLLQRLVQANTWVVLRDLWPGVRYHIQVRSKPDGTSMDGVWGPWSRAVAAETPRSSGDIGLSCSTPDLQHVRCEWSWDPGEPRSSHQLFYRPPPSGASTREDAWQWCEEVSVGVQGTHACTFQPRAGSAISVLVNVTRPHALPTLSYFKEPFWLHQAVLTDAPQLVQATVSQGQLSLQWLPPLEVLAEQLDYQVRYAVEESHDWKVLQVPRAARKEVLDLRPGARYHAQVRAQPSGPWYQGSWSAWSKPVVVDATASAGKGQGRSGGCSQRSHMAEGRRPGVLEMGWGGPSDRAAEGSVVGAQGRATVPAFLLRRRLDHPERYGGAAGLHRSAPGAAVHLPFPLQQREAEALAPRPRPAPHAGQLPPRKQQARPGEGAGAGPAAAEPPRGQLEGRPPPRPLCVSPGQHLLQAAAGGGRPALPAGGAARPAGGAGRAAAASAGARRRPPARHRHRQPVLPAHERLGAARAALSRAPGPGIK
ncbi:thrombopoietin receptor isoform X3 [Haliaeetus albicilla]|uniref:thrombopoietin receptor isoform X3 n=1 Tax=Haliaeetus albicilla TaxID=8969 RepID=UPI0037E99F57